MFAVALQAVRSRTRRGLNQMMQLIQLGRRERQMRVLLGIDRVEL
jgi:hypothetical protein